MSPTHWMVNLKVAAAGGVTLPNSYRPLTGGKQRGAHKTSVPMTTKGDNPLIVKPRYVCREN